MSEDRAGSRGRGSFAVRNTFRKELEQTLVEVKMKTEQVERLIAERIALRKWAAEACIALEAATVIGERSSRPGDGLDYGNHDRLLREARELGVPVLIRLWMNEMGGPARSAG
jgi:hypothetical protein